MNLKGIGVELYDMSLRDLMCVLQGRVRVEELTALACALDAAGVPVIEIGTGLLSASEIWWRGPGGQELEACLRAIVPRLKQAKVAVQLTPGAAIAEQLEKASDWGVETVCLAAHWQDAGLIAPSLRLARRLGLQAVGTMMMAHEAEGELLLREARIMEAEGASCVTLADTSGLMYSAEIRSRMETLRSALDPATQLGFHGHSANVAAAISNSLAAIEGGARRIEGTLTVPGLGHSPLDALCATYTRLGIVTGVDAYQLGDISEGLVLPLLKAFGSGDGIPAGAPPVTRTLVPRVERRGSGSSQFVFDWGRAAVKA